MVLLMFIHVDYFRHTKRMHICLRVKVSSSRAAATMTVIVTLTRDLLVSLIKPHNTLDTRQRHSHRF